MDGAHGVAMKLVDLAVQAVGWYEGGGQRLSEQELRR